MRTGLRSGIACLIGGLLFGCAASHIESAWKDPSTTASSLEFRKLAVVAMVRDGALRRVAEDELVRALQAGARVQSGAMTVTPSYEFLDAANLADAAKAREQMKAGGYDGAVLVSFVSSEQKLSVEPAAYPGVWGYYGRVGAFYDPVSVRTDTIVRIQTDIFSLGSEKLLWTGVSRTSNPRNVERLIDDVARSVAAKLRKDGLLP